MLSLEQRIRKGHPRAGNYRTRVLANIALDQTARGRRARWLVSAKRRRFALLCGR